MDKESEQVKMKKDKRNETLRRLEEIMNTYDSLDFPNAFRPPVSPHNAKFFADLEFSVKNTKKNLCRGQLHQIIDDYVDSEESDEPPFPSPTLHSGSAAVGANILPVVSNCDTNASSSVIVDRQFPCAPGNESHTDSGNIPVIEEPIPDGSSIRLPQLEAQANIPNNTENIVVVLTTEVQSQQNALESEEHDCQTDNIQVQAKADSKAIASEYGNPIAATVSSPDAAIVPIAEQNCQTNLACVDLSGGGQNLVPYEMSDDEGENIELEDNFDVELLKNCAQNDFTGPDIEVVMYPFDPPASSDAAGDPNDDNLFDNQQLVYGNDLETEPNGDIYNELFYDLEKDDYELLEDDYGEESSVEDNSEDSALNKETSEQCLPGTPSTSASVLSTTGRPMRASAMNQVNYVNYDELDYSSEDEQAHSKSQSRKRRKRQVGKSNARKRSRVDPNFVADEVGENMEAVPGLGEQGEQEYARERRFTVLSLNCPETDCTEICLNRKQLIDHLREKHAIERFRCKVKDCFQFFFDAKKFNAHCQSAHSQLGTLNFPCGQCESSYCNHKNLADHISLYHQEGTFQCSKCDSESKFRNEVLVHYQREHQKDHKRKHTRNHPFACLECGKAFALQRNMEKHVCAINKGVRWHCTWPGCGSSYTQKGNATIHVRTRHFHLPAAKKNQVADDIDSRNANDYIEEKAVN